MFWSTAAAIERLRRALLVPQCLSVYQRNSTMNQLIYSVVAAPASDADVVARLLTVTVNGESSEKSYEGPASKFDDLTVTQGDSVILSLVDIDDAGNRSAAATLSFVAEDTIPPRQPGGLGVTLIAEA